MPLSRNASAAKRNSHSIGLIYPAMTTAVDPPGAPGECT
jgi:hypothetical protein